MGTLDADTLEHGFDVFGKIMIADVEIADLPAVAALIERAVAHSVDATDEEKAENRANGRIVHAHLTFGNGGVMLSSAEGYACREPEGHVWAFASYDAWAE